MSLELLHYAFSMPIHIFYIYLRYSSGLHPEFDDYLTVFCSSRLTARKWGFSGLATYAHLKHIKCLVEPDVPFDIAIIGAPFDTAVSYRPGKLHPLFPLFPLNALFLPSPNSKDHSLTDNLSPLQELVSAPAQSATLPPGKPPCAASTPAVA